MIQKIINLYKKIFTHPLRNDFAFSYFVTAVTMLSGFVLMFLITRYSGLAIYGEIALITAFGGILNNILTAKSNEGVVKFAIQHKNSAQFHKINQIIFSALVIDFFLATTTVVLFYALSHIAADYLLKDSTKYLAIELFGFMIAIKLLRNAILGYLQFEQKFIRINSINLLEIALKVSFVFILFFFTDYEKTSVNIILSYLIAAALTTIILYVIAMPKIIKQGFLFGISFCKNTLAEFLSFSRTLYFATFIRGFAADMDNVILGFFTNPQTVGLYQIIKNLISPLTLLSSPIGLIYYPKMNELYTKGDIQQFKSQLTKMIAYVFLATLGLLCILIPFDLYIIKFFNVLPSLEIFSYLLLHGLFMLYVSSQWWIRLFSSIIDISLYVKINIFWILYLLVIGSYLSFEMGILGIIISNLTMVVMMNYYFTSKLKRLH